LGPGTWDLGQLGRSLPTAARTSHRTLGGGSRSAPATPPPLSLRGRRRSPPGLLGGVLGRGKGWGFSLPVLPPDALLNLRVLGLLCLLLGGFTLVSLYSPGGSLTSTWAAQARAIGGWTAAPWCAILMAGGVALYYGRRSLRRAVAGRLAGAALLLLALTGLRQLLAPSTSPPPEIPDAADAADALAGALGAPPGDGGYAGQLFGSTLATWFGAPGAALLLIPFALLGFGLLCGWSLAAWRRLARRCGGGLGRAGRGAWSVARAFWTGLTWSGRRLSRAAVVTGRIAGERAAGGAHLLAGRFRSWGAALIALRLSPAPAGTLPPSLPTPAPDLLPPAGAPDGGITLGAPRPILPPEPAGYRPPAGADVTWELPSTAILASTTAEQISEAEVAEKARLIERTLGAFNVPVTVKDARIGPRVTQFLLKPAEGISVKRIKSFEADLQLVLAAQTLRIELPVPGRPVVGIEIPNSGIATVGLREMIESPQFRESRSRLRLALGRDVDGNPRVGEMAKMPHLLIAGQTGSGKSFCVNSIIASLLFQCTPDELNLLMIDPKMVEMAQYEDIPHLRYPVVIDLAEAGKVLLWAVEEMERRYKLMAGAGFRHLDAYNKALTAAAAGSAPRPDWVPAGGAPARVERAERATREGVPGESVPKPLPYLVIIIDELADLMMFAPDDVEPAICRLTAKARAVGIHLVVATQRPSVDVVTGLIKANMPSRIAFAVSSQIDSRVVLDMAGAESLLGRGDMLYLPYDQGRPVRAQGTYVSDEDIARLVHFWKRQGSPQYVEKDEIEALTLKQEASEAEKGADKASPLLERAMALLQHTNYVSVSYLQRKLAVGYPRAARVLDELEERGLVEADEGNGRSYRVIADALDPDPD
jgi:FtsK/SpoIIIE family/FtsK alpha domain/Ftsk gamma domain